ncbi:sulfurtransferase TusA family protein [Pokkaliibacter plantistimulans]|nr:sulfurtransferase TusA family protein [Pokkaliibacter plantistimulans]
MSKVSCGAMVTSKEQMLDATGLMCPMPLLKAKQALRQLQAGQILHVMASDAGSSRDIPVFVHRSGHTLQRSEEIDGIFHFWIAKGLE